MAESASGIQREILLLKVANELFDYQAVSEAEWRNISRRDSGAWRRQMRRLVNSLEYLTASAEAYSDEISGLSEEANKIQTHLQNLQDKREALEDEILQLRRALEETDKERDELERELSILKELKEFIPIREKLEAAFGDQAMHFKANEGVLRGIRMENEQLSERRDQIETLLSEQDRLLKESILENERGWREIRKKIGGK
ncbi:MAG: hypothetical protein ACLFPR_09465 [Desulfococcaceae bacterium]